MMGFIVFTLAGFLLADITQVVSKTKVSKGDFRIRVFTSFIIGLFWTSLVFFIVF